MEWFTLTNPRLKAAAGATEKPLHLKVVKGVTDVWVGQITEIPGIIVQAETMDGLIKEAIDSLTLYIKTFPNEIFERVPSTLEVA